MMNARCAALRQPQFDAIRHRLVYAIEALREPGRISISDTDYAGTNLIWSGSIYNCFSGRNTSACDYKITANSMMCHFIIRAVE